MHISEGVLSGPVLAVGWGLTVAGVGIGLRRLSGEHLAKAGILAAAFYVASLIHVPIGPSSVHLVLSGLLGLLLGWAAVPAILVGLLLQAIMFQYGGLVVLGVNTVIMAAPAVACRILFGRLVRRGGTAGAVGAFACGAGSVLGGAVLAGLALALTGEAFVTVAWTIVAAHIPVMIVEGFIALFTVNFLARVKPEMLQGLAPDPG